MVLRLLLPCWLVLVTALCAVASPPKQPLVGRWARFEQPFKSSIAYKDPLQEATLTVVFNAPTGETNLVPGFWDGEKTWRVRFCPNQVGRWTFRTICSDATNKGLHNQSGAFICSANTGPARFDQHGPIRVSSDHRHFEHADGTPFFWLADTVWNGARVSELKDWAFYANTRASQQFTVAQWAVDAGKDSKGQYALTGRRRKLQVNPGFFRRLETKMGILREAGILSAVALEMDPRDESATSLSDEQTTLFLRYIISRWHADPVTWLIPFDWETQSNKVAQWKRIGELAFGQAPHAPTILSMSQTPWILKEFRDQKWIDVFGCRSLTSLTEDGLRSAWSGPFSNEWNQEPTRPLITFLPYENELCAQPQKRVMEEDVRRATFWGLLQSTPAGVSYGAKGVVEWDTGVQGKQSEGVPVWRRSLFLPGGKQMGYAAKVMNSVEFWGLRPQPKYLAAQPGDTMAQQFIATAGADSKALTLAYVPEERTIELFSEALPSAPMITWFNPRTGETNEAVAVLGRTCQFPTPDPGDWLLIVKADKP